MKRRAPAGVLALALAANAVQAAPSAPRPTVPCSDVIQFSKAAPGGGYRLVLGRVAVPPPVIQRGVATYRRPWAYWSKAGLAIRAGGPVVSVEVPARWQKRVAITWGNSTPVVSSLRFAACPTPANVPADVWNGYAGGFYLRTRSACVPLRFRVGSRSAIVRFGIGKPCR